MFVRRASYEVHTLTVGSVNGLVFLNPREATSLSSCLPIRAARPVGCASSCDERKNIEGTGMAGVSEASSAGNTTGA